MMNLGLHVICCAGFGEWNTLCSSKPWGWIWTDLKSEVTIKLVSWQGDKLEARRQVRGHLYLLHYGKVVPSLDRGSHRVSTDDRCL